MIYKFPFQKQMEAGPDLFFRTILNKKYEESLTTVAAAVGCNVENLVFVDNITEGLNFILSSFKVINHLFL